MPMLPNRGAPDETPDDYTQSPAAEVGRGKAVQDVDLHGDVGAVLDARPPPDVHGHLVHRRVLIRCIGACVQLRPPAVKPLCRPFSFWWLALMQKVQCAAAMVANISDPLMAVKLTALWYSCGEHRCSRNAQVKCGRLNGFQADSHTVFL